MKKFDHRSPVVQSVVSLTSSLRVISLTVLVDSIYNILIFFAEIMGVAFAHFFSKKYQNICVSLDVNFNESLTNDIVSFEQLGPGLPDIGARKSWDFLILTVSASTGNREGIQFMTVHCTEPFINIAICIATDKALFS